LLEKVLLETVRAAKVQRPAAKLFLNRTRPHKIPAEVVLMAQSRNCETFRSKALRKLERLPLENLNQRPPQRQIAVA
jgi:hypothetical protein